MQLGTQSLIISYEINKKIICNNELLSAVPSPLFCGQYLLPVFCDLETMNNTVSFYNKIRKEFFN